MQSDRFLKLVGISFALFVGSSLGCKPTTTINIPAASGSLPQSGDGASFDPKSLAPTLPCGKAGYQSSTTGTKVAKQLTFVNNTNQAVNLYWLNPNGKQISYGSIQPGNVNALSTFVADVWMVTNADNQCLMLVPNQTSAGDRVCIGPADASCANPQRPLDPFYQKTFADNGILFVASADVTDAAFDRARYIVGQMLAAAPAIREEMRAAQFRVEIIGRKQVLSDLPDYADLKNKTTSDGRSYDLGTRGIGGLTECSIGEENLLCDTVQPYPDEDILVHEFSHSMKSHFDSATAQLSEAAYAGAVQQQLYPMSIYMMQNSQEYWAEATQVWFGKTLRSDVNAGYNTPAKLKEHDAKLFEVLSRVYGATTVNDIGGCKY